MRCLDAYLENPDKPPSKDTLAMRMYNSRSRWAIERSQAILEHIKARMARAVSDLKAVGVAVKKPERIESAGVPAPSPVPVDWLKPDPDRSRQRKQPEQVRVRPTPYCGICEKRLINGEGMLRDVYSNEGKRIGQARVHERCLTKTLASKYRPVTKREVGGNGTNRTGAQAGRGQVRHSSKKRRVRPGVASSLLSNNLERVRTVTSKLTKKS
jgi:hypothetical protein